jgi:hypothetical protein
MQQYYVDSNTHAITGLHYGDPIIPPDGWLLLEGPDGSPTDVYYDGTAIQFKPARPSETAYWDYEANSWQEPPPLPPPPVLPNWGNLGDRLVADIDILAILSANPLFPALVGRLQSLRNNGAMSDPEPLIALWNHHSYSFSEAQLDALNLMAEEEHIPLVITPEGALAVKP